MIIKTATQPVVREAASKDLHKLANLIHFETCVHRHLDYRPPLEWFGSSPFLVLEKNQSITAALVCPPDPPHVAWVRLFAAATPTSANDSWQRLWIEARQALKELPELRQVAAIPMQRWFEQMLIDTGFDQAHRIVMLCWENNSLPSVRPAEGITIRPMTLDDLPAVREVDTAAFPPIWQHSLAYIELAFRQAAVATVAEKASRVVGYQISTPTAIGGHLARLAVIPEEQRQGIGRLLLNDLLTRFVRRGAHTITVNTQDNNAVSLSLYAQMGFTQTSETYPVYQLEMK